MAKLLITGSQGLIGKILVNSFKEKYDLVLIDKELGTDILKTDISPYLKNVKNIIHLAANPNPFLLDDKAVKNFRIAQELIKYLKDSKVERIVNTSSINVYPYIDYFEKNKKIDSKTKLEPNKRFGDGSYGKYKIKTENLFKKFCKSKKINLVNLRLGCVTENNKINKQENGDISPVDHHIFLSHNDLINCFTRALSKKGIKNYVCVSKSQRLFSDNIIL